MCNGRYEGTFPYANVELVIVQVGHVIPKKAIEKGGDQGFQHGGQNAGNRSELRVYEGIFSIQGKKEENARESVQLT